MITLVSGSASKSGTSIIVGDDYKVQVKFNITAAQYLGSDNTDEVEELAERIV